MRNRFLIAAVIVLMMFATTAFAQTSQTINLKTGFNFVSLTTAVSLTPVQFKTNYTQVDDIYLYSAAAGSFLSANEGSLTSLSAGKGYIIKSKADAVITLSGTAPSAIGNITLKKGFNLVGFSKTISQTTTFSQIMTAYGQIHGAYKWVPASGSFLQVVRNISDSQIAQLDGVDPSFKAGESYFLNVDRDTTINYDGVAIVVGDGSTVPYTPPAQTEISGVPVQFLTDLGTEAKAGVGDIEGSIAQPTAAPAFDIVGRVITIKSISNIKVWVKDHPEINTTTDDNGKFTLKDVPAAAKGEGHTLEYEKTEGNDKFKGVIADVPAVEKKKVDLKAYIGPQVIKPAATIQGKVALSDSLSPIGADVYIPGIS
ncbi:MAG TPA: hypothetical protein PKL57_18705, partial [Candidatus Wallbacteria bacterium]|nr:hypothetical protein [Candidatus Wallbacteria bacterium]